ncbi:MAG: hypothetical protein LC808_32950, partial [Actinobacteria bacterium]|nr:hypothetical protein [Actinomycetota bacterium]
RERAVSVHLVGALQFRDCDASRTSESLVWWALPRMGGPQLTRLGEGSGLVDTQLPAATPAIGDNPPTWQRCGPE